MDAATTPITARTSALPPKLAEAFALQSVVCGDLGSPLTSTLCNLISEHGLPDSACRDRLADWSGQAHYRADAVPLRLCGALHRLVLDRADEALGAAYPPTPLDPERLWPAICDAIVRHDRFITDYIASPPQTNEVARSALVLPALLQINARTALPIHLLEIGASAGLNQNLDRFRYDYGAWQWGDPASGVVLECQWRGGPFEPPAAPLEIVSRSGCDIAPVPLATTEDRKRLASYLWADQQYRLDRQAAALAIADAHPPAITQSAAAPWLERALETLPDRCHTVLFHTIMWQYLSEAEKARAESAIRHAGRQAGSGRALTWLRFEGDGRKPGGGVMLTHWSGGTDDGITQLVARGDFHGRWLQMPA